MNLFTASQSVYLGKMIKYRLISWITSKPKKQQSIIKLKQGMTCNNQLQWSSVSYNDLQKYRTLIHYELQMTYYELKWTTMNVHSKRVFEFLGVCVFMTPSGLSFLGSEFSWNKEVWVSIDTEGSEFLLWGGVGLEFFGGLNFWGSEVLDFKVWIFVTPGHPQFFQYRTILCIFQLLLTANISPLKIAFVPQTLRRF